MIIDSVKILLGISDYSQDEKLQAIILSVQDRLKVLLGNVDTVPEELEYIVTEVSVIRFNRIGSEGMSSHSVEGESTTYGENDFAGFMDEIKAWHDSQTTSRIGKVRFI